jgi:hypothetical protein
MPLVIASALLVIAAACGEASGPSEDASAVSTGLSAVESGSPDDIVTPEGVVSIAAGGEDQFPSVDPSTSDGEGEATEVEWLVYEDPDLGFRISYPATLVPSPVDPAELGASALAVIEFRDHSLSERELPFMTVRIQEAAQVSLEGWVDDLTATGGPWQHQDITVAGVSAVQICSSTLMAPGCHVFLDSDDLVYQLVPFGEYGDQMLEAFELVA